MKQSTTWYRPTCAVAAVFIASMAVQENHSGLALNDRYQLIICADDANLLDKNINIVAKNAQVFYSLARRSV